MKPSDFVGHVKRDTGIRVDRSTPWGNRYSHQRNTRAEIIVPSREFAVLYYADDLIRWVEEEPAREELVKQVLGGERLLCWCAPKLCHGMPLASLSNFGLSDLKARTERLRAKVS